MNFIKRKIIWLSAVMLGVGFPVLMPGMSAAQGRHEESHAIHAEPNRSSDHHKYTGENHGNRNSFNAGRWNNGRGNFGNNFSRPRAENRNDHNRHEGERHEGNRRGNDFGLYFGSPYYPYGYYYGYSSPPYGYYNGESAYDMGYNDGFSAGQFDRINGYLYNPRQYERSGNPDYFEGFVAGYEAGYRG